VGRGKTGHAEAIAIYYDPGQIDYSTLLEVFFVDEKYIIDNMIKTINASNKLSGKIVTEVAAYKEFWVAEEYHQNYYELHPNHSYVARVSRPKVEKVLKAFPNLIKLDYR